MSATQTFEYTAKQAGEILKMSPQKIYVLRDVSKKNTGAKTHRSPVLKENEDWIYTGGKVMFTQKALDLIKDYRENQSKRKAKELQKPEDQKVTVIINGVEIVLVGKPAAKVLKLVEKTTVANAPVEDYIGAPQG